MPLDHLTRDARLREKGFEVTQSSVSRDLHDLGVAKVKGRYALIAAAPAETPHQGPGLEAVFRASVTGIAPAGPHLLVVRTVAGAAAPAAGPHPLFAATSGRRAQHHLVDRLREYVPEAVVEAAAEEAPAPG